MTAEEYRNIEYATFYTFEFKIGDKKMRYLGSPHVRDSKDQLFNQI